MHHSRVLIAGLGYVGRILASHLVENGWEVYGLTRGSLQSGSNFQLVKGDLTDLESLLQAARELPPLTHVIHCAASGRGGGEAEYAAVYREGVRHLLAAFPASHLLFTSSTSVYPQIDGSVITEDSPAEPARGTGKLLREAENLALAAGGTVARLAGIYGPERSVLLRNFLQGKSNIDVRTEPPPTPDGRWINQVHQQDIITGLTHLLRLPAAFTSGQIFNLTDSTPTTQRAMYMEMSRRFALPLPPEAAPEVGRKRGWSHKRVSNARLISTGWMPQYPDFFTTCDADPTFLPSIRAQAAENGD